MADTFIPQENVPLAPLTTLRVGGSAEYFAQVTSEEELALAVRFAREHAVPVTVLGGGSNVLIADTGIRGLVIKNEIGGIAYVDGVERSVCVRAGAGVWFDDLIAETVKRELWGLENLSAIPGTVGATPVQNVGAYGVEVGELIAYVRVFDTDAMTFTELSAATCTFAYRDSLFKHEEGKKYIVTAVTYRLSRTPQRRLAYKDLQGRFGNRPADEVTPAVLRRAVVEIRSGKFPDWNVLGTAGSFFKNPVVSAEKFDALKATYPELPGFETGGGVKIPLGFVLDRILGLRGTRTGNVGTYERQALVLINHGGATANEVDVFATYVARVVYDATGITIEREVQMKQ